MNTYYGEPLELRGRHGVFVVQTAWESQGGGGFHNSRVQVKRDGVVVRVEPFWKYAKVRNWAIYLSLGLEPLKEDCS
jgi:hypothetical protein